MFLTKLIAIVARVVFFAEGKFLLKKPQSSVSALEVKLGDCKQFDPKLEKAAWLACIEQEKKAASDLRFNEAEKRNRLNRENAEEQQNRLIAADTPHCPGERLAFNNAKASGLGCKTYSLCGAKRRLIDALKKEEKDHGDLTPTEVGEVQAVFADWKIDNVARMKRHNPMFKLSDHEKEEVESSDSATNPYDDKTSKFAKFTYWKVYHKLLHSSLTPVEKAEVKSKVATAEKTETDPYPSEPEKAAYYDLLKSYGRYFNLM